MFTGLIETVGTLAFIGSAAAFSEKDGLEWNEFLRVHAREGESLAAGSVDALVAIAAPFAGELQLGESVACNGCCLTVIANDEEKFWAYAMPETLRLTTLGQKRLGEKINLERALLPTARLGGHIVSGHVDGVGHLAQRRDGERWLELRFALAPALARQVALKGSIAIDGVSLTITGVGEDYFEVSIIPHTAAVTTLGELEVGDAVNLETDVLAKYVARLLGDTDPEN